MRSDVQEIRKALEPHKAMESHPVDEKQLVMELEDAKVFSQEVSRSLTTAMHLVQDLRAADRD